MWDLKDFWERTNVRDVDRGDIGKTSAQRDGKEGYRPTSRRIDGDLGNLP